MGMGLCYYTCAKPIPLEQVSRYTMLNMTLVCLVLAFNTHHYHICTVTFAFALPSCLLLPEDVSDDDIISMVFTLLSLLLS